MISMMHEGKTTVLFPLPSFPWRVKKGPTQEKRELFPLKGTQLFQKGKAGVFIWTQFQNTEQKEVKKLKKKKKAGKMKSGKK